jgi:hypothetical protein
MTTLLKSESLDIKRGREIKMYHDDFMLHDNQRNNFKATFTKDLAKLIFTLSSDSWVKYRSPLSLIRLYYGEKEGVYFTFLLHHISMLILPAILGVILQGFHFFNAYDKYDGSLNWL